MRTDVLIVGGGPAGCAAAIALSRRGLSALLVEPSSYASFRVGETLPAAARRLLGDLGVEPSVMEGVAIASHALESAWGAPELRARHALFDPFGEGLHLDRRRFDRLLGEAAERQGAVVLRRARAASIARASGVLSARIEAQDGGRVVEARFVIDATGRAAAFARREGSVRVRHDRLVGVVALLRPEGAGRAPEPVLLLEAAEQGWWYSVPLPDGSLLVTYMTDADLLAAGRVRPVERWSSCLRASTHTAARARGFALAGEVVVRDACSARLSRIAGPDWLAAGDAAASVDPLSSDGICKALAGGARAAQAVEEHLRGDPEALDGYARGEAAAFQRYLELRLAHYRTEQRWPSSLFWRRRQIDDARLLPITLDPRVVLAGSPGASLREEAAELEGLLPYREIARLHRLSMEGPREAHALLRTFKEGAALSPGDRALVLALQGLVSRGCVTPA